MRYWKAFPLGALSPTLSIISAVRLLKALWFA
jgi:hypothetical protein